MSENAHPQNYRSPWEDQDPHPIHEPQTQPQPKLHLDWLSRFCKAHSRLSSGMPGSIPFAWRSGPPVIHASLCPPGSAIFAQLTAESHYSLQWAPIFPKLPLPMGDLEPHIIHDSLCPSISLAVFAQLTAECLYTLQWTTPQNCPFPSGDLDWPMGPGPSLIRGSLGQPESSIQTTSRLIQLFLQGSLV